MESRMLSELVSQGNCAAFASIFKLFEFSFRETGIRGANGSKPNEQAYLKSSLLMLN